MVNSLVADFRSQDPVDFQSQNEDVRFPPSRMFKYIYIYDEDDNDDCLNKANALCSLCFTQKSMNLMYI